jgi:hypothetical protein
MLRTLCTSMTFEVGGNRRWDRLSQIFLSMEDYLRASARSAVQYKNAMHGLEIADLESENLGWVVPVVLGDG